MLHSNNVTVIHAGLPSRDFLVEHGLYFFQRFTRGFWKAEEDVNGHDCAKDTEKDVDLPFDVDECRGNEIGHCDLISLRTDRKRGSNLTREIEDPVGAGTQGDCFATDSKWKEFRRVDP